MIAVVEADADDLARPLDRRAKAHLLADRGRALPFGSLPLRETCKTVATKEPLVPILTEAGGIDASAVREDDAGLLVSRRSEPNQFHRITS